MTKSILDIPRKPIPIMHVERDVTIKAHVHWVFEPRSRPGYSDEYYTKAREYHKARNPDGEYRVSARVQSFRSLWRGTHIIINRCQWRIHSITHGTVTFGGRGGMFKPTISRADWDSLVQKAGITIEWR